ncbi:DNA gyrase inhibitor YacG [Aquisphaera insulae]|uniref:DNA gyrase inhibitor YacG n=1 Tax=Aquisphaera insulae TaxID=2712864 RepID=UPI0013ED7A05|nr:DNA gyrase inhibitor YacG [Aquisphaera insulae]
MIKGRCPTCSKCYEVASLDALPSFPFCSSRCRLIDLGRWIDGSFAIPGMPARATAPPASSPSWAQDEEEADD